MRKFLIGTAVAAALTFSFSANAASIISTNPNSVAGVATTPPFGSLVQEVGTATISTGIDFTFGNREGIFSDPPLAFCGINTDGVCDLLSAVDGRIVLLSSLTQGLTRYLYAEAGNAANGSLTLSVFDINNNFLASALNGPPNGINGRTTFEISRSSADIAFFRIEGADTFGVNEIRIETPGAVPEPATWAMFILGFGLIGFAMRHRNRKTGSLSFA